MGGLWLVSDVFNEQVLSLQANKGIGLILCQGLLLLVMGRAPGSSAVAWGCCLPGSGDRAAASAWGISAPGRAWVCSNTQLMVTSWGHWLHWGTLGFQREWS